MLTARLSVERYADEVASQAALLREHLAGAELVRSWWERSAFG